MKRVLLGVLLLVAALLVGAAATVFALNRRGEAALDGSGPGALTAVQAAAASPDAVARGAYLALAGNCAGCHSARGGAPYAGGTGIETPFGVVYASNLTPDRQTGIGDWTAAEFWRALHNGRSRDGRLLYPTFPYPNYTQITRADADAIFAYLGTLVPVTRPNTAHTLRFPYDTQAALAVWRALYFKPGVEPGAGTGADAKDAAGSARGAYLVDALGHCNACHSSRNWLGATADARDLSGGLIPRQNWYAPSLLSEREAGVAHWSVDEIVALLATGRNARASVQGPMADVVFGSTQHLTPDDLRAIAIHLQRLPRAGEPAGRPVGQPAGETARETIREPDRATLARGDALYRTHCSDCHGTDGEGVGRDAYPPLAGNRAVTLPSPANLVHVLLGGGFPPATAGNPRPFGMPPFATVLDDGEIAALLTTIRNRWGNRASPVSSSDVRRIRDGG